MNEKLSYPRKILVLPLFLFLILFFTSILYVYSEFNKKSILTAVLFHKIDLNSPSNSILAVSTSEQSLPNGKKIIKGSKFIGSLTKENNIFIIDFNTIENLNGSKTNITGRSKLKTSESVGAKGVSAKIGDALHKQTKANIIGAIFKNPSISHQLSIIPKGTLLKIELE